MAHWDYEQSRALAEDTSFDALIMAAMRKADSINSTKLRVAFPDTYDELSARYHAPGGRLEGDN